MSSFAVALSGLNLAGLRVLCTIGTCAGLAAVLSALRLDRKARNSSQAPHSLPVDAPLIDQPHLAQSLDASHEIIRLTTDPGPARSSGMSQQQKIAAALNRTGIATSTSWTNPAQSSHPTIDQEGPAGPSSTIRPVTSPDRDSIPTHSSSLTRKLFLLGGLMLALISLILFLTIR